MNVKLERSCSVDMCPELAFMLDHQRAGEGRVRALNLPRGNSQMVLGCRYKSRTHSHQYPRNVQISHSVERRKPLGPP
jgi:hypothetical protein